MTSLFHIAEKERTLKKLISTTCLHKEVLCRSSPRRRDPMTKIEGPFDRRNLHQLQNSQNPCSLAPVLYTAPTPKKPSSRRCQGHFALSVRHLTWSQVRLHILRRPRPRGCAPRNHERPHGPRSPAGSTMLSQAEKRTTCHLSRRFPRSSDRRGGEFRALVQSTQRKTVHR